MAATEYEDGETMADSEATSTLTVQAMTGMINIADELEQSQLDQIGSDVVDGFDVDDASRAEWIKANEGAMKLALQVKEDKTWPWPGAANVKYPLITTAAIQFNARAYPAVIQGSQVVKGAVMGPDDENGTKRDRADRIGKHMSWQLLEQMEGWEEDTDRLLLMLPITGCVFRKTYYDSIAGRNCSDMIPAEDVVFNHKGKRFESLRRITHKFTLYKNEVRSRQLAGVYSDIELCYEDSEDGDKDAPHRFLEQHCWLDLDDDGFDEPYVVTVHHQTRKVVRIVARYDEDGVKVTESGEIADIKPVSYFTKYGFLPNPDGGLYDVGFYALLTPLNESVNTVLNQLLDAGTLSNVGGGFIGKDLRMKGGPVRMKMGEYVPVDAKGQDIRNSIVTMPQNAPSVVLFQLLGMLIEAGRDISNVKDVLTGEGQGQNASPTTTLALIEQGMKVFTAIHKRVHRCLKIEFRKLKRLNRIHLNEREYFAFQDDASEVTRQDYMDDGTDVVPVSDPNMVSDAQTMARADALMSRFVNDPYVNQMEIRKQFLIAIRQPDPDKLLKEPPPAPTPPDVMKMQLEAEIKGDEVDLKRREVEIKERESAAKVDNLNAQTMQLVTEMQAMGQQIQQLIEFVTGMAHTVQAHEQMFGQQNEEMGNADNGTGLPGVGSQPGDQGGGTEPGGLSGADQGMDSGGGLPAGQAAGMDPAMQVAEGTFGDGLPEAGGALPAPEGLTDDPESNPQFGA